MFKVRLLGGPGLTSTSPESKRISVKKNVNTHPHNNINEENEVVNLRIQSILPLNNPIAAL